ncbi:glutamate--tRNA ligase [bacterium]|nr:glutamate--tRNA ligase [bacterium]
MSEMRVRFAPSPTGFLHIGGVRTAIFNWLLARHNGGKFLIRIEDTDKQRSTEEFEADILDALEWLGLTADEEHLRQSTRLTFHKEVVDQLVERGHAFRCFVSPEEAAKIKEAEREAGGIDAFRSPDRDLSSEESQRRADAGEPHAIRFKVPTGSIRFEDAVHGVIETPCNTIDDFILMRSDGTPVYMVAVVADDFEMAVNFVLRGDDHITNTPKQIMIYEALGWPVPTFAHVPLILGQDKKRLSKRHGATAVTEYRKMGYLPEAILSYMAMLGWNPGDDRELLNREELIEAFDTKGIGSKSATFDEQKLEWVNAQFISRLPDAELELAVRPLVAEKVASGEFPAGAGKMLPVAVKLLKSRAHFPVDFVEKGFYVFTEPTTIIDEKAAKKRLKDEGTPTWLDGLATAYDGLDEWSEESLENAMREYAEGEEIGFGKVIHPVRLAVTAQGAGPSLFEILVELGKETVVRRLRWLAGFLREKGTPPEL